MSLLRERLNPRRLHPRRPPSQWERLRREGIVSAGTGTYELGAVQVHEYRTPDGRWLGSRLRIGSYCSIASCEIFLGGNHRSDWVSQYPLRTFGGLAGADEETTDKGDVRIGSDVWIGFGATILSGVSIGHGAVIGARAVVAHDVAPYDVVVGNPARVVRRRFDDETVCRLLEMAWWDWPSERIRSSAGLLGAPPIRP